MPLLEEQNHILQGSNSEMSEEEDNDMFNFLDAFDHDGQYSA